VAEQVVDLGVDRDHRVEHAGLGVDVHLDQDRCLVIGHDDLGAVA